MPVIVQKYGGSSLATPEQIKKIADRVIKTRQQGYDVVVVVSALGDTTDHLLELSRQVAAAPPRRELDMLLSVGERVSIALLAMAINERGFPAISFTGSQVGIITTTDHTRARILEIKGDRIRKELGAGKIVVVAGYQGVSVEKEITTLGRGGSDTTAVALAAALDAEKCEIMTDVDGVYTANPRVVQDAQRLATITYDEMLELADVGAQVLKASAVEFAKRHNIKIMVGSSFTGKIGTIITNRTLDRHRVTGIAHDAHVVLVSYKTQTDGGSAGLVKALAEHGVEVKFVWELDGQCALLLKEDDVQTSQALLTEHQKTTKGMHVRFDHNIGLLCVLGTGINFGTDIMAKVNRAFDRLGVRPRGFHFSETRLAFAVAQDMLVEAVNAIHRTLFVERT